MKNPDQLPSLDALIAACRLYELKVLVYSSPEQPIVYHYGSNSILTLYWECVSLSSQIFAIMPSIQSV